MSCIALAFAHTRSVEVSWEQVRLTRHRCANKGGRDIQRGELMFSSQTLEELEECALGGAQVSLCRCNLRDSPSSCLLINKTFSSRKAKCLSLGRKKFKKKTTQHDHFTPCFNESKWGKAAMQCFLIVWKLSIETDGGKKQGMRSTD